MPFTVYKSSAGSGKTFTLVKEYLKLILPEPDNFRHILAITFTNKAANEMRERVLENLHELALPQKQRRKPASDMLMLSLVKELKSSEPEISTQAGAVLKSILHDYSDFSIGTIDSFSHRIIRTFAHDFGLPINFNVELDSVELLSTAVDLLIDKVGEDPGLTELLVQFLETRMEDEQDWNIDRIFIDFAKVLLDEEGSQNLEKLKDLTINDFKIIATSIRQRIHKFEKSIQALAKQATDLVRSRELAHAAFFNGSSGISRYFEKLSQGNFKDIVPGANARKPVDEDKWASGKATVQERDKILEIKEDLTKYFLQIEQTYENGKLTYYLFQAISKTIFPMAVLNEIGRLLDSFKKQNNIVHISEFNKRISSFILNEPVPFIYERLGEKFQHLLIDEFQDTSVLQWHNLLPLVENSLSAGYFNLVVGDGKQAIYRWRNGDVNQFVSLPSVPGSEANPVLAGREKVLSDHYVQENLNTNFRSKTAIVGFNNALFSDLKTLLGKETLAVYADHDQKSRDGAEGGYVSIGFLRTEKEGKKYKEQLYSRILDIVQELDHDHFRKQDIAILCRRNADASKLAQFLVANKIEVVSSESLLLSSSSEVAFLVTFIRFLHESSNQIICAELITYLYQAGKLKANGLHELIGRINSSTPISKIFFQMLRENNIDLNPGSLSILPVYDLFEELLRKFSLNSPANPYLQFFLDHVLKFTRKYASGVVDFIDWWDKHKMLLSIILPDGLNAVHIMTMHKAKGLQFPVVIIPFMPEKTRLTKNYLWVDLPQSDPENLPAAMLEIGNLVENTEFADRLEEEKSKTFLDNVNLLYVSLTRPEERLYILSPSPPVKSVSVNSVPAFFCFFLKNQGKWSDEVRTYEFGNKTLFAKHKREDVLPTREMKKFISSDWHGKVFIRTLAPSSWDIENPERNRLWGNLIHDVLSRINFAGEEQAVLDDYTNTGIIDEEQRKVIEAKIVALLSDPRIRPFFKTGLRVKNEAEILDQKGDVYRPDRIILDDKKAIIMDFKTGKPNEQQKNQLNHYGKLMMEMGYEKIEKYLLHLEPEVQLTEVN